MTPVLSGIVLTIPIAVPTDPARTTVATLAATAVESRDAKMRAATDFDSVLTLVCKPLPRTNLPDPEPLVNKCQADWR
jgi:hypothetical protein